MNVSDRCAVSIFGVAVLTAASGHPARAADVEYGEYLSSECVTCHRTDGTVTKIPDITGWDTKSFIAVLRAYKTRERQNKVMQTITSGLSDEDMEALAAYFASIKRARAK